MATNNLLEPLAGTLATTRHYIDKHRAHLSKNEIRTRNVLIDPVLRSLGWDVSVLEDVDVEYGAGQKHVDYALLGKDKKPVVLIEAKKLDSNLDSHRAQLLTYSTEIGVPYAVLTDGNRWDLYDIWQKKPMAERKLFELIIASHEPPTAAAMLLILWKDYVRTGSVSQALPIHGLHRACGEEEES